MVGNCTGFAVNRVFFPYTMAACLLLDAGANPYEVDKIVAGARAHRRRSSEGVLGGLEGGIKGEGAPLVAALLSPSSNPRPQPPSHQPQQQPPQAPLACPWAPSA